MEILKNIKIILAIFIIFIFFISSLLSIYQMKQKQKKLDITLKNIIIQKELFHNKLNESQNIKIILQDIKNKEILKNKEIINQNYLFYISSEGKISDYHYTENQNGKINK